MYEKEAKLIVKNQFSRWGFTSHQYPNAIGLWPNEQESLVWGALNSEEGDWLEIGSFCGGSAVLLCLASKFLGGARRVTSVDINFDGWNRAFDRNVYRVGRFQDIHQKIETSSFELRKKYQGNPLSFVFIDGWHSFKGVLTDYEQVEGFLTPNAMVAFHDTAPQPYKIGEIDKFYQKSTENFNSLMSEELPGQKKVSLSEYHASEKLQNFFIDEAIAFLVKEKNFEYIDIPVIDGSTHFDRVKEYKHGTTSPYHGLVILRRKNEN